MMLLRWKKYDEMTAQGKRCEHRYEYGAGYWGTKTRALFLKKYLSGTYENPVESEDILLEAVPCKVVIAKSLTLLFIDILFCKS